MLHCMHDCVSQHCLPYREQAWKRICAASRKEFQAIYDRLGVRLIERGESAYNPLLRPLVEDLCARGIAEDSDGAKARPGLAL